ncbi:MAG TPA: cob(I)yrinic acid a,c-diamide adenosyltransferase [Tepidisphaeraceae bacterium]|nr:cob(I)yrinic acid a,c-diamide adenosyltransferase [Tepidisphaeraceae bacterium]
MKIYTRTGDDGTTGLVGGRRVPKSDPRIDCYGTVDELNASLGLAAAVLSAAAVPDPSLVERLRAVQGELFVIGAHLATAPDERASRAASLPPPPDEGMVLRLEGEIDSAESRLPPLHNFILPGGTEAAARLHLARTVCRRAERLLVGMAIEANSTAPSVTVRYLNRLSDWLFVQARLANFLAGVADIPWSAQTTAAAPTTPPPSSAGT